MEANLRDGDALHRVDDEDTRDEVACAWRQVAWQVVDASLDFFEEVWNEILMKILKKLLCKPFGQKSFENI